MDFHNLQLGDWASWFVGVSLADEPDHPWIVLADKLQFANDEFQLDGLRHVDDYLVALNEHSQSAECWDQAVYVPSVTWAGAYVGEVLRKLSRRRLEWTTFEDALALNPRNADELGERTEFNDYVLCTAAGEAISPMNVAAAVFTDGCLQSVAQFVDEEAGIEEEAPACDAFLDADQRNDEFLHHLAPEARETLTGEAAHDHRVWARHYWDQGVLETAKSRLFKALQADPFHGETLRLLAELHSQRGDRDRALAFYQRGLAVDPNDANLWTSRGEHYRDTEKFELALTDIRTAVEIQPDARRWRSLGQLLGDLGRHGEAVEAYAKAIAVTEGENAAGKNAKDEELHELQMGMVDALVRAGEVKEAQQRIDELVAEQGEAAQGPLLLFRARVAIAQGDWSDAAADYLAAANQSGVRQAALAGIARVWATAPDEALRQPDKALQAARKAQQLDGEGDPNRFDVLDSLASALARCEQFSEAIKVQQQAVAKARRCDRPEAKKKLKAYKKKQPWTDGS